MPQKLVAERFHVAMDQGVSGIRPRVTNESPSSLGERSNVRKTIRVAWGKVLEWVTKASLLS
jgi:hypothetical protein